ncbi:MAG: hypothetical protein MJZ86_01100 [Bacteroidales bacterium]|nr:hypothetical protein [Bacteroidales bacterium]
MLRYLLDHNILPDASLVSLHDEKHGRKIAQDNTYFLARCMRCDSGEL